MCPEGRSCCGSMLATIIVGSMHMLRQRSPRHCHKHTKCCSLLIHYFVWCSSRSALPVIGHVSLSACQFSRDWCSSLSRTSSTTALLIAVAVLTLAAAWSTEAVTSSDDGPGVSLSSSSSLSTPPAAGTLVESHLSWHEAQQSMLELHYDVRQLGRITYMGRNAMERCCMHQTAAFLSPCL